MRFKQLLTKTLLVAAGLCVGATSTWGQILYSWEGGDPSATETGGTAVATDNQSVNYSNSDYKTIRLNGKADYSSDYVTITLSTNTLQAGDIIRVTAYRTNSEDKTSGFKAKFNVGEGTVASSSGTDFNNIYSGDNTPNTLSFEIPASAAGSSTITMTRSHTGTNLFITKIQIVRPIVNADIDFSGTVTDYVLSGATNTMTLSNNTKNEISDGKLVIGPGTNTVTIPVAQRASSKDKVILTFEMSMGKWDKMYTGFRIKDASGTNIGYLRYGKYNGICETNLGITTSDFKEYNTPLWARRTYFTITIDYESNKIYTVAIWHNNDDGTSDETKASHEVDLTNKNSVATFEVFGEYGNSNAWERRCQFDNLKITTITGDYSNTKTITYAYQDNNGADISTLILTNGGLSEATADLGDTYTPEYPSSVTDAEYAYDYTYTSGGDAFTVTNNATITLIYTKAAHPTTDVTVQYKSGVTVIKEEKVAESYPIGKPLSYGVHQYVLGNNGVFYQTTPYYYRTNNAAATLEESVTESGISNVLYFTEAESVTGASSQTQTSRSSNGKVGYTPDADTYVSTTTLPKGKYKIYMRTVTANSGSRTFNFKVGEKTVFSHTVNGSNTNNLQNSEEFTVTETSVLSFACKGGGGSGNGLDWFYVKGTPDNDIVGAVDYTTEANAVRSSNYTMKKGDTKVFTFQNHGTTFGNNWRIEVKEGETWKANVCADSYDYTAGARANVTAYTMSYDGGANKQAINDDVTETSWATYATKMADARCVATLSYGTDGTLHIITTSTNGDYIYYVDHDVTGLTNDLTINLSVNHSWLEILSTEQTAVGITPAYANSTYCSAYDLDFSGVDGLKAYIAASDKEESSINLSSVDQIKARQGMVLVGTAGTTYSVPVTTGVAEPAKNHLEGVLENTDMTGKNVYILGTDGLFHPCNSGTLAAGKAYLNISSSAAKSLNIMFDNETLGINDASLLNKNAEGMGEKAIYNLSGQRIAAPQKGINIIGGRKVVVK